MIGMCFGACGGGKPAGECKKVERILLELNPSAQLNPGDDGASRSVLMRVYQLAQPEVFEHVAFEELWQTDTKALFGDSLLAGPDELLLVPGEHRTVSIARHPGAQFVAVAGKFRNEDGAWKAVAGLPPAIDPCSKDAERAPTSLSAEAANANIHLTSGDGK